ncbi:MAG: hypothetical protein K2Y27_35215 [Xanthobacteraceae bacterium]|nr:hypothetical protein [Xanthobacteraceae bacterium]
MLAALAGLKNAFMTGIDWAWSFVIWPLRLFGPGPGRSALLPPPDVAGQIRDAIAEADELEAVHPAPSGPSAADRYAVQVMQWASATTADRYAQAERISNALPAALRTWTLQMTTVEARVLLKARIAGISAHLDGSTPIEGVRPVVRSVHPDGVRPDRTVVRSRPEAPEPQAPVLGFLPSSP